MSKRVLRFIALLVAAAGALAAAEPDGNGRFRASVVKIDITPDKPQWLLGYQARQSEAVLDRLFHRIAALDDGNTQVFLVSTDICVVQSVAYNKQVLAELERQTGIKAKQVWWTTTHTHSAPEVGPPGLLRAFMPERCKQAEAGGMSNPEYSDFVTRKLTAGIQEARAKLAPARLAIGLGWANANINRRAKDADGVVTLGMNPDGPVDRQIGLIRLEHPDGKPLALIANYAIHGTVLSGASRVISGDVPGVVAEYVEKQLGVPMLFVNGAEGNLAPIYSVYADAKSGHLNQFRALLGDKILEANQRLAPGSGEIAIRSGQKIVETPLKIGLSWPADLSDFIRVTETGRTVVRIPVRSLVINRDTAIWGAPLELFCEIAMSIRGRSPFAQTFYFGMTDGWLGYMTTRQALLEKGYEPRTSPYTEQAENDFTEAVSAYLASLAR
jgi:hypothetical protein